MATVMQYRIKFGFDPASETWYATDASGHFTARGKSQDEALENLKNAIKHYNKLRGNDSIEIVPA